ncbi:amino acid ABC transporter substrate-binding protein [Miniphocaeibacter halophilus]|uniref:Amino acid ABC transporter substrate-binding protein n=1 Tax=Miniphocaeibacter halophilus TaxID=2931922 RepID=A0AC61MQ48_9FIRM|nr:amino acid ABC transporter substrate-binding protein [Miniphocaeibacter halophilus]QQK07716.1 amino acid ABC transporter substrate-binding protein [Miniphocaeibacter halophilus]
MKKRNLIMVIVLTLSLFLVSCSNKNEGKDDVTTDNNTSSNTLIVGFDANFPPMGFKETDGSYTGFDLELAKLVADKLEMELVLQPIDWASKDAELDSGNINVIWNGFTKTGREEKYTFSEPYMENRQLIVVNEDSEFNELEDLKGKNLELQDRSTAEYALEDSAEFKESLGEVIKVPDNLTALNDLEQGSTDAVLMDEVVAKYNINKGRKFRVLEESLKDEEYAIAFKLGNEELRDKVDKVVKELASEGVLKELSIKWIGEDKTLIK